MNLTVRDRKSPTGLRVHLRAGAMPANKAGRSDLRRAFAKRSGLVVINARTRKRQLVYAELDANAKRASDRMLLIHPGKHFDEGAR